LANTVIVAGGSLMTPLFLIRNGVHNPHLGRHLSIHPTGFVSAYFPGMNMRNGQSIPQGFYVADLIRQGIVLGGATPPLLAYGMGQRSLGRDFVRIVERYSETACFGFLVQDKGRGTVHPGRSGRYPIISYRLADEDFSKFLLGLETLIKIYFAAGAQEVYLPGCSRAPVLRDEGDWIDLCESGPRPQDFLMSAYHPLGTARLGTTPSRGVCDADHRVFGWQGLYVMDGSAIPGSLGVNPQITIMTLALRAARRLGQRI
jgi:hypothetical protein